MKVAVIGGGVLGLTLAHRLARMGHQVEVFEAGPQLGGLAGPQDYGEFVWDRFYHCILPQDTNLLGVLDELGLSKELRWTTTGTGYYGRGQVYSMSGNADFLRFPLLTLLDKLRMGAAIVYATRVADPFKLYRVTAKDWLTKICGRRNYEVFWQPLLKAKLGTHHDKVAAVFIWATLTRLFGARTGGANKEKLGYVSGGYARILGRFAEVLQAAGVQIHLGASVTALRSVQRGDGKKACDVTCAKAGQIGNASRFDQVFFTAPTRLARKAVSSDLLPHVERMERDYPTSTAYLGVACCVLALKKPLTPYYVLNIGDSSVELTGLIEMTNLIDPASQTGGRTLVYLPRYLDSEDPQLEAPDAALLAGFMDRGLKRLFPAFTDDQIVYRGIHRAKLVQPLPLASDAVAKVEGVPALEPPFQMLSTFMLRCATLNNNEVVGLVDEFVKKNDAALRGDAQGTPGRQARPNGLVV